MARRFLFVDEAGNFDFSPRGSAYFILTSVALDDCSVGDELLDLRRRLVWEGNTLTDAFHAAEDRQAIRDEVFRVLRRHEFRVDATILAKASIMPQHRTMEEAYRLAWFLHMKYIAPRVARPDDELLTVAASVTTRSKQQLMGEAIADVMRRTARCASLRTAHWPAPTDPCLQVADYCCWAIQRKWERQDLRSYVLIADRIQSEFEAFREGGEREE